MEKNGTTDNIIKNGLIVLDANALLNVYRFNKENRDKYIEILDAVKDRLFLTYQSVKEFYNNRLVIIYNKSKFKVDLKQELNKKTTDIINMLENDNFRSENKESCNLIKHEQELKNSIIGILNKANKEIEKKIDSYNIDIDKSFINDNDSILDKILEIFEGKINESFTDTELDETYKLGKERYEKEIPPGYKDIANKSEPDCYGDLIIWNEIIKIAKEKKTDILFVSDDRKPDWCDKFKGYDLGPRKELIKEFFNKTNKNFHSITTKDFIKYISNLHTIENTTELEKESEIIRKELLSSDLKLIDKINKDHPGDANKCLFNTKFMNRFYRINENEISNMNKEDVLHMLNKVNTKQRRYRRIISIILDELYRDENSNMNKKDVLRILNEMNIEERKNRELVLNILGEISKDGGNSIDREDVLHVLNEINITAKMNREANSIMLNQMRKGENSNMDKEAASSILEEKSKMDKHIEDKINYWLSSNVKKSYINENIDYEDEDEKYF